MRPDDPLGIRSDFPVVEQAIYLASAAITPTPNPVTQAGVDFVRAKGGVPIGLDAMFDKCDELRARFAALIQVTTPEVGIIYTTSEAENLIVRALNLQPGDNIVTDDLHYSASYVIYDQLVKRGIDVRIAPRRADGSAPPAIFAPLMDSRTRLLSVAWISHQNGYRHDLAALAELAHGYDSYIYADVIQGAGVLPLDVRAANLDFCAAGSYKWMLGAFGVALFYVRESLLEMMTLDRFGYFHVERKRGALDHQLRRDGRKFMYATPAFGPIFELTAGLRYLEAIGIEKISQHCIGLAHYLFDQLSELEVNLLTPPGNLSHIVAFAHGLAPQQVKAHLAGRKIHVNFRDEDRHIRIGAALFNNRQEIDAFVAAMSELYQRA